MLKVDGPELRSSCNKVSRGMLPTDLSAPLHMCTSETVFMSAHGQSTTVPGLVLHSMSLLNGFS